jgi:signal peptidase I
MSGYPPGSGGQLDPYGAGPRPGLQGGAGPTTVQAPAGRVPGQPVTADDLAVTAPSTQRRTRSRRRRRLLIEWVIVLAVAAVVAVLLRAFVVQAFFVPSPSMVPTLQEGDRILVIKTSLLTGAVKRGSIVVFHRPTIFPCSGGDNVEDLVKRVIGLPGETIWSSGNTIFVDGKPLHEAGWYRSGYPEVGAEPINRETIPAGDYFVMGDNRTDSCDSRVFGPIPSSSVVGQVELIVWRNGHPYFHAF